jgi:Cdc6-like AAA superfamily ATPase
MNITKTVKSNTNRTIKLRKSIKGGNKIDYLSNVCLIMNNTGKTKEELKEEYDKLFENIMKKSFDSDYNGYFNNLRTEIENNLPTPTTKKPYEKKEWLTCKKECYNIANKAIMKEMKSTAYMLRVLSNSLISHNKCKPKLYISYENNSENGEPGNSLNGIWNNDKQYFTITKIGKGEDKTSRLIMGLGPSASGKTYWAKNVIELLNTSIDNFPSTFFTIDGGDYRGLSQVYQIIIESAKKKGLGGIDNLVLAGISMTKKNIFDSNIIKKDIITYLETSQLKISLYVPETLGDCGRLRPKSCDPKINEYVKLTNDKDWVALMIYQHKTAEECPYDLKFQCTGTTSSGKSRETDEGKKYSNSAYEHSISQGLREITKAPNLKFIIHNSGGKKYNNEINKSIITDLSTKTPFDSNKIQDIESKFHCIYNKSDNINNFK